MAYPQDTQPIRDHIVLESFIDGLHNVRVRVELRQNKPTAFNMALESALHFDATYRLEANANETPTSATSVSSIEAFSLPARRRRYTPAYGSSAKWSNPPKPFGLFIKSAGSVACC